MAEKLDPKEIVTLEELALSNMGDIPGECRLPFHMEHPNRTKFVAARV